jgi:lipopolysaccharide export system permease protein
MKKLDLYIIKKFLGTFFFMLALIMAIAVVFDVSEKLDKFSRSEATTLEIIVDYYVNFVFYFGNLFSSLFIFLSVLLFTSQMAQRSEIIAILASGISFRRMLRPYMIAASILVVISLYFTHYQLSISNTTRINFENQHLKKQFSIDERNLLRQIEPGTIAYFQSFNAQNNVGYKFSLEKWNSEGKLTYKLMSERARYDSLSGLWQIDLPFERFITDSSEEVKRSKRLDTLLNMVPSDLGHRLNIASTMGFKELNDFIKFEKLKGSDKTTFFEIEKHQRTSFPFAAYILTIIAVSVASRRVRGGIGIHLALGVFIALTYIFAMKITTVAATNAGLNPLLAVWLPNIVFGAIAVWLYTKAQK